MSRISESFSRARKESTKGFIPFVTAGDPTLEITYDLVLELAHSGATVIELGVPFSDPMADGPIIQRASERVLARGDTDLPAVLNLVTMLRKKTDIPIVLFGYLNPFLQFGISELKTRSAQAGVDGFLITDVVESEFVELAREFQTESIDLISLVAPTTTDDRLETIAGSAGGFVYAISRTGVTGRKTDVRADAKELVERTRAFTDLPIAVGFGISTASQVSEVLKYADAAVVGSKIVSIIEESEPSDAVRRVSAYTKQLLE